MHDTLFSNIALHIHLAKDEQDFVRKHIKELSVKKNDVLLNAGKTCQHIYFVESGCLRIFSRDKQGMEHNVFFSPENWWASDIHSFTRKRPATFHIDALEDCQLVCFEEKQLQKIFEKIPQMERFFRMLFQNALGLFQRRLLLVLSTPSAERYALFHKQYPFLELRISQKHIASYLGITPVFLSNIRRNTL